MCVCVPPPPPLPPAPAYSRAHLPFWLVSKELANPQGTRSRARLQEPNEWTNCVKGHHHAQPNPTPPTCITFLSASAVRAPRLPGPHRRGCRHSYFHGASHGPGACERREPRPTHLCALAPSRVLSVLACRCVDFACAEQERGAGEGCCAVCVWRRLRAAGALQQGCMWATGEADCNAMPGASEEGCPRCMGAGCTGVEESEFRARQAAQQAAALGEFTWGPASLARSSPCRLQPTIPQTSAAPHGPCGAPCTDNAKALSPKVSWSPARAVR